MAYQRTEYADKTLSMNSLADRKLRIKLGSIDSHKETIEKEMKRERKKLERELGGMDEQRTRLTVSDIGDTTNRSPRFTRRYSTPPELLSATLPPSLSDPKRSPLTTRRRLGSDGVSERLHNNTPSPISPTSMMFLKAPFDQPRRQSLPPIGDGGLLSAENCSRRDRRGSHTGGTRSPLLTSPTTSGVVQVIPIAGNCTADNIIASIEHQILPLLPRTVFLVADNASVHNEQRLSAILRQRNTAFV
ncbi:hypothetical protein AC249_AIPGENE15269 [Exaiptasia diaphana]|nr:hypothetical protein AC249_AIPGENE15269 [Exaiptasia diaphana]